MKRTVVAFMAAAILTTGLSGCVFKERDQLRTKVADLEQQLNAANAAIEAKDKDITMLRDNLQAAQSAEAQTQAQLNGLNAELNRTKAELEKAKASAAKSAAKKKKKRK